MAIVNKTGPKRTKYCSAIRGLLCQKYNTALGLLNDNVQTLKNAVEYLKSTKEGLWNIGMQSLFYIV